MRILICAVPENPNPPALKAQSKFYVAIMLYRGHKRFKIIQLRVICWVECQSMAVQAFKH